MGWQRLIAQVAAWLRDGAEPPQLSDMRWRLARIAAWVTVAGATGFFVTSLVSPDPHLPGPAVCVVGVAVSLALLAGTIAGIEPVRTLTPITWAAAMVLLSREPYITAQIGEGIFVAPIVAALVAGSRAVVATAATVILGFALRGGVTSPYLEPMFLMIWSVVAALLVVTQRALLGVFARLGRAERRFQAIASETNDVIYIARPRGRDPAYATWVSASVQRVLGYSPEEFAALDKRVYIHPDDQALSLEAIEKAAADPGHTVTTALRIRHGFGHWVWLDTRITNLMHHPDVNGVVITFHDESEARHQRAELERRLAHQATHDPLTGLPNRRLLLDRLGHAIERARGGGTAAILFCDLDDFKLVNDSLGHDVGDLLLTEVAARMQTALRPSDTAARLGGDEFIMLLEDLPSSDHARAIAARIIDVLREPFEFGGRKLHVQTSIGVAAVTAEHDRPEAVVRDADVAMYRAKEAGKNRVAVFEPAMQSRLFRRHDVEQAMRRALQNQEFLLHYQPKVAIADGRLAGFEALLRWEDAERGIVGPGEFIPVAEETGLIVPLGRWVLEQACQTLRRFQQRTGFHDLSMAVNLSGRQLHHGDLIVEVERVLRETGVDPGLLELEITETVAMSNAAATIEQLTALKRLGVKIGVDDFGTGYSSLVYLRRFPVDVLKIDRAFVAGLGQHPDDEEIVRFLIGLAKSLGLSTVAEGVETEVQLGRLRELGCDLAQGYLIARPMSVGAAEELVRVAKPMRRRA